MQRSVLEVGITSHGLDGVVGTVGHRRGSPGVEMHRITQHKVNIFVGDFLKLCNGGSHMFHSDPRMRRMPNYLIKVNTIFSNINIQMSPGDALRFQ